MKRITIIVAVSFLFTMVMQSCKQGCTNPKAYNYMKSAKADDGSCLYCDSVASLFGSYTTSAQDLNSSSPHYNQTVMRLDVEGNALEYTGNGCTLLGHNNNSGSCQSLSYSGLFQNETSSTLVFSGTIPIYQYGNSVVKSFAVYNISIGPYATDTVYLGQGDCLSDYSYSIQPLSNTSFTYH